MEVPFRKLTITDVENATYSCRERIDMTAERALQYLSDPEKSDRHKDALCVPCYYGTRIGGAAMTHAYCGICRLKMLFNSTSTDKLCQGCALRLDLCKHCGSVTTPGISRALRKVLNEFARQDENVPDSTP